ncbi:DUF7144 family membrane protein [Streptomyces rishiriensis]|uniref:DUF7144 family membrane protein n=1 Tax=Streptomyces rishiriensis TaxID=68264 RepID=UPI004038EE22
MGQGVGVESAGLSMTANFLWLPRTPWWAVLFIAIAPSSPGGCASYPGRSETDGWDPPPWHTKQRPGRRRS